MASPRLHRLLVEKLICEIIGVSNVSSKVASTALVKAIRLGKLSPESIARAASTMPEGKFRYLSHLGTGQFTAADKVLGSVGGFSGEMVRKMPIRYSPDYVAEGVAIKQFIDKLNTNAAKRLAHSNPSSYYYQTGASPIAPILGVASHGVFQRVANAVPMKSKGIIRYLNRRVEDLHPGNYGPKGQVFDAAPNFSGLAPGVPTNLELTTRELPSFIPWTGDARIKKPNHNQLNLIRRLFDQRLGTYQENMARIGSHAGG